ncbi:alpha/beta fold hydrolase [Cupriavidus pinatubonensis]|uniref:Pimeloyl-[acyl-carrier protein] methyl ester esterase n=1 Tax=Cupriavidus pinatubonensis TaxID=248026 RepID=A0ABM8XL93_9BURK|nr:alpha/beta hydrolase [Cupriavidus pinatubonensis]CAG9180972.1 Pimeloyl-[acyl-carrier protein] methyl ester esterase [Cupriavidus pinatubonensis]
MTNTRLPDYSVTGDGDTTVFLLHGAFGAKDYWRDQIAALVANGYRVVAWDAPGYGMSPLPDPFSVDVAATALARLIDAVGGRRNVLLGHSMGGMIAQAAFDLRREHVHGLVLSATSAAFGKSEGEWQQKFVRDRVAPLDAGKTIAEFGPDMLRRMMAPGATGPGVARVIEVVSSMRPETFRAAIHSIVGFDGRHILSRMQVPVLCIAGEHDLSAAPPAVMEKLAGRLPHGEFVCMGGVGHFAWAEQPEAFNRHLLDFLQRRLGD